MKSDDIQREIDRMIQNRMKYELTDEDLDFAESDALDAANRFLNDWQDWNEDDVLKLAADYHGVDYDFIWLASRVLFGPAVVWLKTGKAI